MSVSAEQTQVFVHTHSGMFSGGGSSDQRGANALLRSLKKARPSVTFVLSDSFSSKRTEILAAQAAEHSSHYLLVLQHSQNFVIASLWRVNDIRIMEEFSAPRKNMDSTVKAISEWIEKLPFLSQAPGAFNALAFVKLLNQKALCDEIESLIQKRGNAFFKDEKETAMAELYRCRSGGRSEDRTNAAQIKFASSNLAFESKEALLENLSSSGLMNYVNNKVKAPGKLTIACEDKTCTAGKVSLHLEFPVNSYVSSPILRESYPYAEAKEVAHQLNQLLNAAKKSQGLFPPPPFELLITKGDFQRHYKIMVSANDKIYLTEN